jgi:integrase
MAKIRKRGNTYQIDYFDPTGKRVRQSFKKRKEAEEELAKRVSLIAENPKRYLEIAKATTTTFDELLEKYRENFKHQRSFYRSKRFMLTDLEEAFKGRLLSSISYLNLESYRNRLRETFTRHGGLRADASVNRVMACLRHMFSKAVEWGMIDRNPFERGRSLQLRENNRRLRYLGEDEIIRLLDECATARPRREKGRFVQGPQAVHLRDFVVISIHTGMRKGESLSLRWNQIRGGFIYLEKTKTDQARQIPIDGDLEECLKAIRKRQGLRCEYVLADEKGRALKDIKTAFGGACRRAGIRDLRPHDLRHTFASHYMMRGGSLAALQKILGHADIKMTMRYAHLSKEFARTEIQNLNGLTSGKAKNEKAAPNLTALSTAGPTVTKRSQPAIPATAPAS